MVMLGWWVAALLKEVLKSAMAVCGEPYVATTHLAIMPLEWCASSWDYQTLV